VAQTAYVNADSIRFAPKCPHCGRAAETTRSLAAQRNIDALFGEYGLLTLVEAPVCRSASAARRRAGIASTIASVAFIFIGGFLATAAALNDYTILAVALGVTVGFVALLGRTGWDDALLDRALLGVNVRRAGANRLRITFTRDDHFSEWAAMNPLASASAGAMGWRPPPKPEPPPDFALMSSRRFPAIALASSSALIALHHWFARSSGEVFMVGLCLMTALAFLSIAGLVYPPLFWAVSTHGRHLAAPYRVAGAVIGFAGLAAGFLLGVSYGR